MTTSTKAITPGQVFDAFAPAIAMAKSVADGQGSLKAANMVHDLINLRNVYGEMVRENATTS